MTPSRRVLLVNPKITSRSKARFPLSVLTMAGSIEGEYDSTIIDGNVEVDCVAETLRALGTNVYDAVGITVMGGPQVQSAIDVSKAIRARFPLAPIVWGGYFPTLYPAAAINAPYVDYLVRGQGEDTFLALLSAINDGSVSDLGVIAGLTWRSGGEAVHNGDRKFAVPRPSANLPYEKLGNLRQYLPRTFMGQRTAAYQAALGCRFRCTFCGVAAMFRGATALPAAHRLERDLVFLRDRAGADSIQFYDHNFFDRETDMMPLLEVLAKLQLPWWCYARADALLNLSAEGWALVRKSHLRMAYIGAESPNDEILRSIRKGTRSDQTMAVAELCRRNGVIPELSFMVAPPQDPEGETERTFDFIRRIKRVNPDSEIIVYVHTPLPPDSVPGNGRGKLKPLLDHEGRPVVFPKTPEEWTEQRWIDYSCHADAPWVTARLRRRIRNFVTVLGCRYPTVQDAQAPPWTKSALRALASWRYRFCRYDRPWELDLVKHLIRLADPRVSSI
ncbi:MAG: B12-binding domain-containing radical SAM protein [Pseudomonadota bacterium]|nr:B12-binding domain-containing radical SAM protein [Pseudomonadota bacterium]